MLSKEEIIFFKKNRYLKYPRMIQIEITNKCPLNCPQCYKELDNLRHMDKSVFVKTIDEANRIGVKHIMINGGEPLLHPLFVEFIKYLNRKGMYTTCYTSGLNINKEFIEQIKGLKLEMIFSLNGSCKEVHELSRDGFEITMNAIRLYKKYHESFYINWVARHDNVKDFNNLLNLAKEKGALGIVVVGNKIQRNGEADSPLTKEDYEFLKTIIINPNNEKYINIQNCYNVLAQYSYNMPMSKTYGCSAGITGCFVTKDGNYAPCSHLDFVEKFESLEEYWEKSKYLKRLREMEVYKLTHCDSCIYSLKCRFCRAFSKKTHDDFSVGFMECPVYIKKEI